MTIYKLQSTNSSDRWNTVTWNKNYDGKYDAAIESKKIPYYNLPMENTNVKLIYLPPSPVIVFINTKLFNSYTPS